MVGIEVSVTIGLPCGKTRSLRPAPAARTGGARSDAQKRKRRR